MAKFRVEFNTSGFYQGAGIWTTIDEIASIEADDAQEAIEGAVRYIKDENIQNCISNGLDIPDVSESDYYAYRASKITYDEDGFLNPYEWEFREAD